MCGCERRAAHVGPRRRCRGQHLLEGGVGTEADRVGSGVHQGEEKPGRRRGKGNQLDVAGLEAQSIEEMLASRGRRWICTVCSPTQGFSPASADVVRSETGTSSPSADRELLAFLVLSLPSNSTVRTPPILDVRPQPTTWELCKNIFLNVIASDAGSPGRQLLSLACVCQTYVPQTSASD
ncbi:hypothetical protein CALVIDRAFT_373018 [Calocera viscosa TUFC12733]|uniref:Uncharacterized protein n=1 Tax=Calocera viscosa (strain TUFC12733) TaxID=1330018 RepID=A0A167GTP8_CALVF|nr:hypothetical protein CALVIDRAFT_373018 [Calocera viscosa TUFC12733]